MAQSSSRREFIFKIGQISALSLVGGAAWSGLLFQSKATAFALRPPGALSEKDYIAKCIKCGLCIDACPYDTLSLGKTGENATIGVPKFEPRDIPCYMCTDVPCARACPSGALEKEIKIEEARMGLAVLIDQENCIAFQGLRCEVCYRVCPLMDKAITLNYRPQERTGKHAYFEPVVHSDACTGCGMCEHACILEKSAIRVLPSYLAKGKKGDHYRLGWEEKSNISVDFKPEDTKKGKELKKWEENTLENALDTLGDDKDLYE
jgi:ferredoxin-type protein NapG